MTDLESIKEIRKDYNSNIKPFWESNFEKAKINFVEIIKSKIRPNPRILTNYQKGYPLLGLISMIEYFDSYNEEFTKEFEVNLGKLENEIENHENNPLKADISKYLVKV